LAHSNFCFLNFWMQRRTRRSAKARQLKYSANIGYKKLSEITAILPSIERAKRQIRSNSITLSKGIAELNLDENNILVMDLADNGRNISIVVNQEYNPESSYFVMNLNIIQHDGIESYFITKYIPADGKPFYNYSEFIGTVEFYDLDGNLLSASQQTGRHLAFILGCYAYVIQDNTGTWMIQNIECICSACGGGGAGGETGGSDTGSGGYGNNGYGNNENGGSGGSGGGDGSGNNTPGIPNIPSEDVQDQKKYSAFLGVLNTDQTLFLYLYSGYNTAVFNYLKENNFRETDVNLMKIVINHLMANTDDYGVHILWEEISPMFDFVKKFLQDNPDTINKEQIFVRIKALEVLLKQNPDGLLDIECQELPKWKDLANHQIPQSVKNRVNQVNAQTGWFDSASLQSIYTGGGPSLNMDLFPVKINSLPNKPGTNTKYTPAEFFDYFRKNINSFVYGSSFSPVDNTEYNINDTALWNSNNPLGAFIHITIPGNDGTVITSGFNSQAWVFTTVDIPWDDQHPVSGNRLFGYYMDGNSMYLYSRGVDRFTFNLLNYSATWTAEGIGFNKADDLWSSFQTKIADYVNKPGSGGNASIIPSVKYRPSWINIRNYIKGKATLNSLGCH